MAEELNGKKLDDLAKTVDDIATNVNNTASTVDEIKAILMGNTKNPEKKGLLERIRLIEKWISDQIEGKRWTNRLVIAAIVGNSIGLIFIIIKYYITLP
jgi:hypothetical protein